MRVLTTLVENAFSSDASPGRGVLGIPVAIGSRVAATAGTGEVLVSQTVKDLVAGTGLLLEDRGQRQLKGVPGTWRVYAATEGPN